MRRPLVAGLGRRHRDEVDDGEDQRRAGRLRHQARRDPDDGAAVGVPARRGRHPQGDEAAGPRRVCNGHVGRLPRRAADGRSTGMHSEGSEAPGNVYYPVGARSCLAIRPLTSPEARPRAPCRGARPEGRTYCVSGRGRAVHVARSSTDRLRRFHMTACAVPRSSPGSLSRCPARAATAPSACTSVPVTVQTVGPVEDAPGQDPAPPARPPADVATEGGPPFVDALYGQEVSRRAAPSTVVTPGGRGAAPGRLHAGLKPGRGTLVVALSATRTKRTYQDVYAKQPKCS